MKLNIKKIALLSIGAMSSLIGVMVAISNEGAACDLTAAICVMTFGYCLHSLIQEMEQ